jgi:hypothetical protein
MRLRVEYGEASVYYEDKVKAPTPEYVDDLLHRLERSLNRIWDGKAPAEIDLSSHEADG